LRWRGTFYVVGRRCVCGCRSLHIFPGRIEFPVHQLCFIVAVLRTFTPDFFFFFFFFSPNIYAALLFDNVGCGRILTGLRHCVSAQVPAHLRSKKTPGLPLDPLRGKRESFIPMHLIDDNTIDRHSTICCEQVRRRDFGSWRLLLLFHLLCLSNHVDPA